MTHSACTLWTPNGNVRVDWHVEEDYPRTYVIDSLPTLLPYYEWMAAESILSMIGRDADMDGARILVGLAPEWLSQDQRDLLRSLGYSAGIAYGALCREPEWSGHGGDVGPARFNSLALRCSGTSGAKLAWGKSPQSSGHYRITKRPDDRTPPEALASALAYLCGIADRDGVALVLPKRFAPCHAHMAEFHVQGFARDEATRDLVRPAGAGGV